MGQMDRYESDFESSLLEDASAYYSQKASNWILEDSCPDYMLKVCILTVELFCNVRFLVTKYEIYFNEFPYRSMTAWNAKVTGSPITCIQLVDPSYLRSVMSFRFPPNGNLR